MMGLGGPDKIEIEETMLWKFKDDYRVTQIIKTTDYYISVSSIRLFSTHIFFVQEQGERLNLNKDGSVFTCSSGNNTLIQLLK